MIYAWNKSLTLCLYLYLCNLKVTESKYTRSGVQIPVELLHWLDPTLGMPEGNTNASKLLEFPSPWEPRALIRPSCSGHFSTKVCRKPWKFTYLDKILTSVRIEVYSVKKNESPEDYNSSRGDTSGSVGKKVLWADVVKKSARSLAKEASMVCDESRMDDQSKNVHSVVSIPYAKRAKPK